MLGVPLRSCKSLSYPPGLLRSKLTGWRERLKGSIGGSTQQY